MVRGSSGSVGFAGGREAKDQADNETKTFVREEVGADDDLTTCGNEAGEDWNLGTGKRRDLIEELNVTRRGVGVERGKCVDLTRSGFDDRRNRSE